MNLKTNLFLGTTLNLAGLVGCCGSENCNLNNNSSLAQSAKSSYSVYNDAHDDNGYFTQAQMTSPVQSSGRERDSYQMEPELKALGRKECDNLLLSTATVVVWILAIGLFGVTGKYLYDVRRCALNGEDGSRDGIYGDDF